MTYNVHDIHPTASALPGEALRIEALRKELMLSSEEIRRGADPHPERTIIRLGHDALFLATSAAPMFEKLHVLNAAHANIRAGGFRWHNNMRTIAGLSRRALKIAYPVTKDPTTNQLNRTDIATRRRAIRRTSPTLSFPSALEEAWTHFGHPIDPLIETTEQINLASRQAAIREQHRNQETGALIDLLEEDTAPLLLYK
ncbi:MAG: hypothetical protein JWP06_78 [Candidatus Saccharibacteria bacterium]|nr:hypothetical protein [Candidatus Saccharibacteria bacterium]